MTTETTSIGSWPGRDLPLALALQGQFSVPALPELPELSPSDSLLGQKEGLPPTALFEWVSWLLRNARPQAKLQRCGPLTLSRNTELTWEQAQNQALQNAQELLLATSGYRGKLILLWDEPSFAGASDVATLNSFLRRARAELKISVQGVHCCASPPATTALPSLECSIVSFDLDCWDEASWKANLPALLRFATRPGNLLILGTAGAPAAQLRLRDLESTPLWLSPSCGLAGRSIEEVNEILTRLLTPEIDRQTPPLDPPHSTRRRSPREPA